MYFGEIIALQLQTKNINNNAYVKYDFVGKKFTPTIALPIKKIPNKKFKDIYLSTTLFLICRLHNFQFEK